jgi:uncharacterized GH25 family protein
MKKRVLIILSILVSTAAIFGHEYWLESERLWLKINEEVVIKPMVGEGYLGEHVAIEKLKPKKFEVFSNGNIQIAKPVADNQGFASTKLSFEKEGNYLLALNNGNKYLELEADKFNEYLIEEGLDDMLELRKKKGELGIKSREYYQRCVKTLLQVGDVQDKTFSKNTGMRLELIPDKNPYQKGINNISFQVLFDNKPVNNALVLVWKKENEKSTVKKLRANKKGKVTFELSPTGRWMISSVKMIPFENRSEADWQSFWGSYTFGWM